ncbi:tetratricopeptide repeat protein [Tenacibaculum insulae]|uniref:tetratricopeptide repeat-containing sensor histidine kinase n=1 Tax=Tenacibaculum insulae TaxID=2029677 RepID=UPI003AB5E44B
MKNLFTLLLFSLLTNICFSQQNIDSLILDALNKKETNYFKLKKHFKKVRFTANQINSLLEKSKEGNYVLGEIYAKNSQGLLYRDLKEYDKAIEVYSKSLVKAKDISNIDAEIVTLNQIGVIYKREDKVRQALNYFQESLELISKINAPTNNIKTSKSIAVNCIGDIYLELKQYERALDKFNESIAIDKEIDDKVGLAISYQNIGYAYESLNKLDLALDNYQKSLRYNTINEDILGQGLSNNSIANILIKKGNYEEAYKFITKAVVSLEKNGKKDYLIEVYDTLASVLIKVNKNDEAERYLNKALKIGEENNMLSSLSMIYKHFSELNLKKGNNKVALDFYKKAIELDKKSFEAKNNRYINSLISKYDSEVSSNKLKHLAKETEIAKLKLLRNRNILIIALVSIALFGVLLYSIYRQRLLKNDKQILLLEQDALRIQMNPHFVFNALNSIKLYIINNEQKNAVRYLNKFAKLVRNILESSTVKEVSLEEELKTMDLYMSIENIRFSNEISYQEKINSNLNLGVIKIPPLVLQPFLENAIWHGLSSKKGSKKVNLSVDKLSDEFIQIDIVDNGVGREEAFRIKSGKSLNRKSIGIDLTKERLHNFSAQFQSSYSLTYTDLLDVDGNPKGTKVSIKIPIV